MNRSTETKDAPAFDFYPERFWFAVEGWTDGEIVRYFRLLSQQWMRGGLPEARREIEAIARGKLTERVLEKFPTSSDDGKRRNLKLEIERAKQRKRIFETSWRNAKVAWMKHHKGEPLPPHLATEDAYRRHISGMPVVVPEPCQNPATGTPQGCPPPTTHPIIERESTGAEQSEAAWIEQIQNAYPDRSAQWETTPCINASIRKGAKPEDILAGTKRAADLIKQHYPTGIGNRFVPKAKAFFLGEKWMNPEVHFTPRQDEGRGGSTPKPRPAYTSELREL